MKLLYDYQIFDNQVIGGVSRYFFNLMKEFEEMQAIEYELALRYTVNEYLLESKEIRKKPFANSRNKILRKSFNVLTEKLNRQYSIRKIKDNKYDVFHPIYYSTYFLDNIKRPFVLTVYDMIHEKFNNQYFKSSNRITESKRILCNKASLILAISENTKQDLIKLFNIPEEKVRVTHLSGGFDNVALNLSLIKTLPDNYILFVGSRAGYKNFDNFLNAIIPLMQQNQALHLICTGPSFSKLELARFKNIGGSLDKRIIHHFSSDKDFYTYYNKALAFVFPTLYEGFGIPTLEAFSADCPAIISNTSSLPEVGGGAAIYFNPLDIESMTSAIRKVIYNNELRTNMIEKGRKQLKLFGWNKTAANTINAYNSIF